MTEKQVCYCYHCRTYHPREEMRRVLTATGYRWRCLASIRVSRRPTPERDAFGREISEANRAAAKRIAQHRKVLSNDDLADVAGQATRAERWSAGPRAAK